MKAANPQSPVSVAILWVMVCFVVNGFIFMWGWNDRTTLPLQPWFKPPGWAIGLVWTVLFATMGLAHGHLLKARKPVHLGVAGLLLACLAYPFYTGGLQSGPVAFWGTLATLAGVGVLLKATRGKVQWLLLPVALWLCFAVVLIHATLRLNGASLAG